MLASFRTCGAEDAVLISRIHAASWRASYRDIIAAHYLDRLPEEYWVPTVRSWLQDGRFSGLFVLEGDKPVGCCIYGRGRDESHDTWGEIVSLYMLPEAARKGLGGALLVECLAQLRLEGYTRFYLWAFDGNVAADRFYHKHGFRISGESVSYSIGSAPVRELRYVKVEDQSST